MKSLITTMVAIALTSIGAQAWSQSTQAAAPAKTQAATAQNPNDLVQNVAQNVLRDLDANRAQYRQDPSGIRKMVDKHLLPYFDTEYAARLVLGQHWRNASADQRKRFVEAFYQSLLQNYGEAMLEFTPDRLKILPFRGDPASNSATVRTEVRRDNGQAVPVNFSLRKTPQGWKAWDVTIEGISYVRSYKTDFNAEINQKGLDAVIARLESQIASGKAPKPAGGAKETAGS